MRKKTRSILEELSNLGHKDYSDAFIASTGSTIIESAINILSKIHDTYDPIVATELERRFISAIKTGNPKKFKAGVDRITESKRK